MLCLCRYSDAVVGQILDELGLQLNDQLSGLPQATGSLSVTSKYLYLPPILTLACYSYYSKVRETGHEHV